MVLGWFWDVLVIDILAVEVCSRKAFEGFRSNSGALGLLRLCSQIVK